MGHKPAIRRLISQAATFALAAAAAGAYIDWLAGHATPVEGDGRGLPLLVMLVFKIGNPSVSAPANAIFALIAIVGLAACALAIVLAWRSATHESARRLSLGLALISCAVAYFFIALPHSPYREALGLASDGARRLAFDTAGYLALAAGLWSLARFFEIYPRPISRPDWDAFVAELHARAEAKSRTGWRARAYGAKREGKATRAIHLDEWQAPNRSAFLGFVLAGGAIAMAASEFFGRRLPPEPPGTHSLLPMAYALGIGIASVALLTSMIRSYRLLQFHQERGLPDDRSRIEWIFSTTLVGGMIAGALPVLGLAAFTIVVATAGEASANYPTHMLLLYPYALALPLFAASFVAALGLSIFYRGAVDPRLAARRITAWWLLGALIALLFIVAERAVAVRIVQWLGLPPESGLVIAGGLVAGTIAPIRRNIEDWAMVLAGRFLPIADLMDGERRRAVVAMSDLSGYTALSVRDEKQALLVAALLHRTAEQQSRAAGGRMVKSIGDAVMLEFADASSAARALRQVHAQFAAGCATMGLEPLPVHSGAHVGEVVVGHDDDLFGQTVNLTARLQGEAKAGQIVVSTAFIAALGATPPPSRAIGARKLKNIPEAVDCHELLEPA